MPLYEKFSLSNIMECVFEFLKTLDIDIFVHFLSCFVTEKNHFAESFMLPRV